MTCLSHHIHQTSLIKNSHSFTPSELLIHYVTLSYWKMLNVMKNDNKNTTEYLNLLFRCKTEWIKGIIPYVRSIKTRNLKRIVFVGHKVMTVMRSSEGWSSCACLMLIVRSSRSWGWRRVPGRLSEPHTRPHWGSGLNLCCRSKGKWHHVSAPCVSPVLAEEAEP